MSKRELSSIFLVAGTCIGGGTIALPMVLAKIGVIPSIIVMILIWMLNYYPSLTGLELNLRSEKGLSLGELGKTFSGVGAQAVGEFTVKILSYAVLTLHLCGSSSIIQKLLEEYLHYNTSILTIETCIALFGAVLLLFPFRVISTLNNMMFMGLIFMFFIILGTIVSLVDFSRIPWMVDFSAYDLLSVCPVMFAAYGYQLILHTLRDHCGNKPYMLKKSVFLGGLIPTLVYILWSSSSLSAVFNTNPDFFMQMVSGKVEVGSFVSELAKVSSLPNFQLLVWLMSILAILTSFVGVGLGLAETLNSNIKKRTESITIQKVFASVMTIAPAYAIAAKFPNAFIKILGFAGALFVIMGILLPTYLLFKNGMQHLNFKELKKWPLVLCAAAGILIILAEVFLNN